MTEIECIDVLKNLAFLSTEQEHEKCEKAIEMAIQTLSEIQQYRAIGTIEEFKAFKLGRLGNKGFITIGQTIEEFKEEIRAKAIDEFISRLEKHTQENWVDHQEYGITWADIEQIAEQMKGGGNSED